MNDASVPPPPPLAAVPAGPPLTHGGQALILLVALLLLGIGEGLAGLGHLYTVFTGPDYVGEEGRIYRLFGALLDLGAAAGGILVGAGAMWASRQVVRKLSQSDVAGAQKMSQLAKLMCYFGWILLVMSLITIGVHLLGGGSDAPAHTY